MKQKICTCNYYDLKKRGYQPMDHKQSCPMCKFKVEPIRFKLREGLNPFKEIDNFREERSKLHYEKSKS
jgi:hypothetical protein